MKDVIKQVEEVLRKAGYTHLHVQSDEHFHTVSAENGEAKFVAHITDREQTPTGAGVSQKAVPTMHVKPTFPVAEAFAASLGGQVAHAGHSDALELAHTTEDVCKVC